MQDLELFLLSVWNETEQKMYYQKKFGGDFISNEKCFSMNAVALNISENNKYAQMILRIPIGKKDYNGKVVYEGDIVKSGTYYSCVGKNGHLLSINGYADIGANFAYSDGNFEIIGNIYENPEFAKKHNLI